LDQAAAASSLIAGALDRRAQTASRYVYVPDQTLVRNAVVQFPRGWSSRSLDKFDIELYCGGNYLDLPAPVVPVKGSRARMMSDSIAFRFMTEIGIIHQLGSTVMERSLHDGLTLPQFAVLNHLVRSGHHQSPIELARAMQVTKATMSSTLGRLERKGLISSNPDPQDGRSRRIATTAKGRKGRDRAIEAIATHLASVEKQIGTSALEAALPLLEQVRRLLDDQRSGG
jgi:DNA-binding MarR family transcriptional regulator